MDDIYNDLDNYEDLNLVEELKKENHDLKLKLEEYTIAMSKLQKDFDKLSSDFKKLEMNYSSLLKTAKVEIERKTKIITDLNIEKDMIVLNALQNRNINDVRKLKNLSKPFTKGHGNDSSFGKARSNVPLADNNKGNNNSCGRKDDIRFSSVETTTTSGNTDITSKLMQFASKNSENVELWSDRTSDTKENMTQRPKKVETHTKPSNTQALSIKNRRKSMPAVRSLAKYSSDEECEDRYCSNDANRISSREDPNRHNVDKVYNDRHRYKGLEERNKPPEMSNVDDKYYGYPEPSRDSHRSRNDRHYGTDKHRSRSKYDLSLRHRRNLSPDRSRRPPRNDDYQRQEYGRYRVLESPPPDKYQHYQQRNQETRFKRDRDDKYELENRDNCDKYSSKHKTPSDHYDEPISKRRRTDSFNKFSEEDVRWNRDRPLERPMPDLYENLHQDLSCQSPDYTLTDLVSSHPIREIMNTASSPLEDPRIHSEKYILKTSDDNVALSTVIGRNVKLKMLDTSLWNDRPAEVPKALTRRPSQCSEDIVKEIYMDIDNPVSNMSAESGEILSNDLEDNMDEGRNVPNESDTRKCEYDLRTDIANLSDQTVDKNSLTKYKIPKVKKNESEIKLHTSRDAGVKISQNKIEHPPENLQKDHNSRKISERDPKRKTQIEKDYKLETPISRNVVKKDCAVNYNDNYRDTMSSMKELVAGDLELSDETCDNSEIQKSSVKEKPQSKDHENKNKTSEPSQSKVTSLQDMAVGKNIEKETITQEKPREALESDSKKRSIKKKLPKHKEPSNVSKTDSTDKETNRKAKSKKDIKDPKEIKTKFSELFGDSSSLITPEDLGIMAVQAQVQPSATYVPICEDAQDAVDVPISKTEKIQTRLSKLKASETEQPQECLQTDNDCDKTETKSKINNKSGDDTKKKTRKSTAQVTDKSKIREVYQSLTADKLVTETADKPEAETADKLVTKKDVCSQNLSTNEAVKEIDTGTAPDERMIEQIATAVPEKLCQIESDNNCNDIPKQSVVEHIVAAPSNDMPLKPNLLMQALATSTPQKELQKNDSGSGVVGSGQISNCPSSKETSTDNVTADMSSTNETLNPQNDGDIPDVRIFVKRKRRVKIAKK
ncbi:hypothetical protein ABMA27_015510 [Loxostege sticticalis]|uniref:Uncharacterized protein n=1 Tax=Loxostege sticticalis TaxID=481309 RepID=A0ABR3I7X8_LOXSC